MKTLTPDRFALAVSFLNEHGRPLDQASLAFCFEGGSPEAVLAALEPYQNADGGFGHALEADVRLDDSSVIATTMGLQALRKVDADASHPLVRGAVAYLLEQLDPTTLAWVLVPPNVDDAPHAPWWAPEEKPTGFTANPGAEIVGHFHHWASLVPAELLAQLTETAMAHLRSLTAERMHDVFCYEATRKTESVPAELREEMLRLIRPVALETVETDPTHWGTYCTRPLQIADSPDSPYYESLRDAVAANLDYLIDTQQPDGAWTPHWSWGNDDDGAWEQAKRDWQGTLIVDHLNLLRAFGRLEG